MSMLTILAVVINCEKMLKSIAWDKYFDFFYSRGWQGKEGKQVDAVPQWPSRSGPVTVSVRPQIMSYNVVVSAPI